MDQRLYERAQDLERQIERLAAAEEKLWNLEASEKTLYSNLYLETQGTVAEREAKVETNKEWIAFKTALKDARVEANKEKRMFELLMRAGDWEYGTMKIEEKAIRRQA